MKERKNSKRIYSVLRNGVTECISLSQTAVAEILHRTHTSEGLKGEARARTNPVPVKMKFATVDGTKHKGSLFVLSVLMASCGAHEACGTEHKYALAKVGLVA